MALASTASTAASAPAPSSTPQIDTHGVRLEALAEAPLPSPLPHVEIVEPAFGDVLDARLARHSSVRVRAEGVALGAEREGVLVSLDGKRPRRWLEGRALSLGDLLADDEDLAVGAHALLAVALAADGRALRGQTPQGKRALSQVSFFVGARPQAPTEFPAPSLFCLSPTGTSYDKAGAPLLLDVLAFGAAKPSVRLRVRTRQHAFELPFDVDRAYSLSGLPFGDVWLTLGDAPGPSAQCVITLNPPVEARP